MSRSIPRVVACLTLALACFIPVDGAVAGVGAVSGGTLSSFAHSSPAQRVQAGECWEQNGRDGPGYYPCGDGGGPVINPLPPNPAYSHAPARRLGAGATPPGLHGAAPVSPGLAGVHGPGEAAGAHVGAPASSGVPGVTAAPHIAAPASPGSVGPPSGGSSPHRFARLAWSCGGSWRRRGRRRRSGRAGRRHRTPLNDLRVGRHEPDPRSHP
jgi:hypothetical protein